MLHNWIKNNLPDKHTIKKHASMGVLDEHLHHPALWCWSCRTVSRGVAIGLLVAFLPLPFQMLLAAGMAILLCANLPTAVALTWITNPITFVPINYAIYWVGKIILSEPTKDIKIPSVSWSFSSMQHFWASVTQISKLGKAYLIGLPIVAITVSLLGYVLVQALWHLKIFSHQK